MAGWKTFIFGLLVTIFGALETFDFTSFFGESTGGLITSAIGVIIMVLRAITKTPVFKSE